GFGLLFYKMGNINLGSGSVINRDCLLDNRAAINIGENVSISGNVQIYTGGHDPHSPLFEMTCTPVTIHDHVVIFSRATIMPGVTIGKGAVVYACAVVCKDVPSMAIIAGNPGVVIGCRKAEPYYEIDYSYPAAM
ncbi:MAG: acyltransferase, partial [Ferruginibacter sp.]